jgi:hypothetical protein
MKYSDPYRERIPKSITVKVKKWGWDFNKAFRIGGLVSSIGIGQLLLILILDLPRHDYRAPFVRLGLALFSFAIFASSGIVIKTITKTILE